MPVEKQAITLNERSHIVVGTPGRVIDHMKRGNLILDQVRYLVIDEADLMLDMGFMEDVEYIVSHTGGTQEVQMFLFRQLNGGNDYPSGGQLYASSGEDYNRR